MSQPPQQNPWRVPLLALGGDFMTGAQIKQQAEDLGIRRGLYFRGRIGVLGDVTPASARDVLAIFPGWLVDDSWASTAEVAVQDLVTGYAEACHEWGRERLSDLESVDRLAELLRHAVDGVEPVGAPLARAWQRASRPDDAPALAAHLAMVLREIRGGLHFAALSLVNLPVVRAALADDLGGTGRLRRTGWSKEAIEEATAAAQPEDPDRWREAEAATEASFLGAIAEALGEDRVNALGSLVLDAYDASRR